MVLVGQSIGGLLVRLYAENHPDDIAGLVLVDPTHESDMLFNLRVNRWVRLRELATERAVPAPKLTGPTAGDYDPALRAHRSADRARPVGAPLPHRA